MARTRRVPETLQQRRERLAKRRVRATAEEERPEANILTEYSRRDRLKRRVTDMNRLSLRTRCRNLAAESYKEATDLEIEC